MDNYIDITKCYVGKKKSRGQIIYKYYFISDDGEKYYVSKNKVILDPSIEEIRMAKWFSSLGDDVVYINPKVNYPPGISTSDYIYKDEKWDLKIVGVNATSTKRAVDNIIKTTKNQTNNIILDITKSKLDRENIIEQVKTVFLTRGRQWIRQIVIVDDYKVLKAYKRCNENIKK